MENLYEYIACIIESFWRMKYGYHNYSDKIWNQSGNVRKSC